MAQETDRLRRRIEADLGDCCEADVDERLAELDNLDAAVPERASADLAVLGTLADETRYRLVWLLVAAHGELCVCELESVVDVSSSAVSHALSDLEDVGLAQRRRDGRWRFYTATDRAESLLATLSQSRQGSTVATGAEP